MSSNTALTILFALLVSAVSISAHAEHRDGKWWKVPQHKKNLQLTDDQVSRIDFIFASYEGRLNELHNSLKENQFLLRNRIRNPNSTSSQIRLANEKVEMIKTTYRKTSLEMYLRIREILTPKQRIVLQKTSRGEGHSRSTDTKPGQYK